MSVSFTNVARDLGQLRSKSLLPIILGISIGFALSMVYIPVVEQLCLSDIEMSRIITKNPGSAQLPKQMNKVISSSSHEIGPSPTPVTPKKSQFNYDFRPYFIYSELGFRYKLIIAVLTSERRLDEYAVAINNTWAQMLPKVVFFTPYSKNINFHEKYNRNLNLNVVQLPDVDEDSTRVDLLYKMLQHLKDHYAPNYHMFMKIDDNAYINPEQLLTLVNNLNSSEDLYVGHAMELTGTYTLERNGKWKDWTGDYYCLGNSGIILSRSSLIKLASNINSCSSKRYTDENQAMESCVRQVLGISCKFKSETQNAIQVKKDKLAFTEQQINSKNYLRNAAVLYPIHSGTQILQLHKYFTLKKVKETFASIRKLQTNIQKTVPFLPADVSEKVLRWPIGFIDPFKPNSRFEVIYWRFFDREKIFGQTDSEPVSKLSDAQKTDLNEVHKTALSAIQKELETAKGAAISMRTGFTRHDPKRGSEYIMDFSVSETDSPTIIRRVHLLRPFTKVEALSMPPATEQRGIHLVLPVTRDDISNFEIFLQMYKRVCLQTGENVVLLTVFINIRKAGDEEFSKDDPFKDPKNLIARYKRSYMWAQLPWLQVGVKQASPTLIMDIVSMKLASNALIFLVSLDIDFTINFLNRCRVNAINGAQTFFPIPFMEYDPEIVFKNKQKPTFVDVYRDNGAWDKETHDIGCFCNRDYKDLRMLEDDFLDENQSLNSYVVDVFQKSKLTVFRAVDSELRRRYTKLNCSTPQSKDSCLQTAAEQRASKPQLAKHYFVKEMRVSL